MKIHGNFVDSSDYTEGYYAIEKQNNNTYYRVIRSQGIVIYNSPIFAKKHAVGKIKAGQKVKVQKVVQYKEITRLYIGHGKYITANKTWINKE